MLVGLQSNVTVVETGKRRELVFLVPAADIVSRKNSLVLQLFERFLEV